MPVKKGMRILGLIDITGVGYEQKRNSESGLGHFGF